jgi:hypothetical protein
VQWIERAREYLTLAAAIDDRPKRRT